MSDTLFTSKQKQALKKLYDKDTAFLLYGGAAMGGKTWLGCYWIYSMCMMYAGTRWFIGRDSLKDTRESVQITWSKLCETYGFTGWKYGENEIIFANGSHASFLDLSFLPVKDPFFERLGSKEYTGGWIEEAGEIKFDAFDVLKSRIGRHMNDKYNLPAKMLITANPKKGWLYSEFYKPYATGTMKPGYAFIPALYTDNDKIPDTAVQSLNSITDKIKRQRLLMGDWDYDDDDNSMIPYNKIMDCFTNDFVDPGGKRYISSDVAITNDKFVIVVWEGFRILEISSTNNISKTVTTRTDGEVLNRIDFTPLIAEYERLSNAYKVPRSNIVYDADGIGHNMRTFLSGAVGLNNGSPALSPEYFNLKTQLYYLFAEMVNSDQIYIAANLTTDLRDRLVSEMQSIRRSSEIGEKLRIMPKAEVKQILGHSPDLTDAIVYRLLFWLTRKS